MKKSILLMALVCFGAAQLRAQIGIGTPTPNPNSVLDLKSPKNNQGLLTPSVTTAQRLAPEFQSRLGQPENGLLVYDTDAKQFYFWTGTAWDQILNDSDEAQNKAAVVAGGDLTGTYPNPVIAPNKVTTTTIQDATILNDDISNTAAITDAKLATIVTPGKVSADAITSGTIAGNTSINTTGTITAAGITVNNTSQPTTIMATSAVVAGTAVSGKTSSVNGGSGVLGQGSGNGSTFSAGVLGKNLFTGTSGYLGGIQGVYGENKTGIAISGIGKTGVSGNGGTTGNGIGLYGAASGVGSFGIYSNGAAGGTTTWSASSDRRFKKNITPLENGLARTMALRGVTFDWRTAEFPDRNFTTGHDVGFIAQEVQQVLPEVVRQDDLGFYSVSYEKIVPVLVEAIHQQQAQIEALQQQVNQLVRSHNQPEAGVAMGNK